MYRILIIEDDPLIAEIERDYLLMHEFAVEIELNGKNGFEKAMKESYDMIILDLMLPDMDGFEICRRVRMEKDVAIIMVTARKEDIDKIRGFGLGADDYVVKPFSPNELVARVKAHIQIHERLLSKKQSKKSENGYERGAIDIQHVRILPLSHQVYVSGKEIVFTRREFELFYFLASNPNIVFSKETLFDRLWGMDAASDVATVMVYVNRVREKIELDSSNPQIIETVWGAGYRLNLIPKPPKKSL